MYIIGTAGHVDHGKTALVKALTGTDTDRLPEEKRRGMTIELGFACMRTSDGSLAGLVDVPGHERFIRNMVAGTWALQCVMLIVAADDGWMRQTEDHARVMAAMGTPAQIVVVTKIDKVEHSRSLEVAQDACARCKAMFGHDVPHALVSALQQQGIEELRTEVSNLLRTTVDPRKFPCCLYVDRSFILPGSGTVVTGSLMGESVRTGQSVRILPDGGNAKIRSLQTHNLPIESAQPCSRTAMTLQGIKNKEIPRGACITTSQEVNGEQNLVVLLNPVPASSQESLCRYGMDDAKVHGVGITLRNHQHVEAAFGTWHALASIHVPQHGNMVKSTGPVVARLAFGEPAPCFWGQRMVLMRPGGSDILCGAQILWLGVLEVKLLGMLADSVAQMQKLPEGIASREHMSLLLHGWEQLPGMVPDSITIGQFSYERIGAWHIRIDIIAKLDEQITRLASAQGGATIEEVRGKSPVPSQIVSSRIRTLVQSGTLVQTNQVLSTQPPGQRDLSEKAMDFLGLLRNSGLYGMELSRMDKQQKLLVRELTRESHIVVLDATLVYPMETYRKLAGNILYGKPVGSEFSIAQAKEHVPLSRKYIIPLLNKMEEDGLVARIGDARKVLRGL